MADDDLYGTYDFHEYEGFTEDQIELLEVYAVDEFEEGVWDLESLQADIADFLGIEYDDPFFDSPEWWDYLQSLYE